MRTKRPRVWSIGVSIATIAFTIGVATAAWSTVDGVTGTRAGVFHDPTLDLRLGGASETHAFIGRENMAPGDNVSGALRLYAHITGDRDVYDLDFDVRFDEPRGNLTHHLVHRRLVYGGDDLLSGEDGGRDLLREIDANPVLGNGDGRLSLRELGAGVNDLTPPRSREEGGTALLVEVELDRHLASGPGGGRAEVTYVFHLADRMAGDLN